jgi:hypothetical protein
VQAVLPSIKATMQLAHDSTSAALPDRMALTAISVPSNGNRRTTSSSAMVFNDVS